MRKLSLGIYRQRDEHSLEEVERTTAQAKHVKFRRVSQEKHWQFQAADASFGTGNMVPFTRVPNPWKKPHALHYSIPACGAHGRLLRCSDVNHVPDPEQQSA